MKDCNCFVCFSSPGLLAHSGSHFVWADKLGSLILFVPNLFPLLLAVQWLKPLGFGLLKKNWNHSLTLPIKGLKQTTVVILFNFNKMQFSALYSLRDFELLSLWYRLLQWFLILHLCFDTSVTVTRVTCGDEGESVDQAGSRFIWAPWLLYCPPGHEAFLLEKEIHVHCADAIKAPSACTPGFVRVIN